MWDDYEEREKGERHRRLLFIIFIDIQGAVFKIGALAGIRKLPAGAFGIETQEPDYEEPD